MVILYSHNSFEPPSNFYGSYINQCTSQKPFSIKGRLKELTVENKKFLQSLGLKLQKRKN